MVRQLTVSRAALVVLFCCLHHPFGAARWFHGQDGAEVINSNAGRDFLQLGGFIDDILGTPDADESAPPNATVPAAVPAAVPAPATQPLVPVAPAPVSPVAPVAVPPVAPVAPAVAPSVAPAPAPGLTPTVNQTTTPAPATTPASTPSPASAVPAPTSPEPPVAVAPVAPVAPVAVPPQTPAPDPVATPPPTCTPTPRPPGLSMINAHAPLPSVGSSGSEAASPPEPPLPVVDPQLPVVDPLPPPTMPEPPVDPELPPEEPREEPDRPPEEPAEEAPEEEGPDSSNDAGGENGTSAAGSPPPDEEDSVISRGVIVAIVAGVLVVLVVAIVAVLFGGRGCGSSRPPPPPPIMDTPLPSPHALYGGTTDVGHGTVGAQGTKYFVPGGNTAQYSNIGVGYLPPDGYGPPDAYGHDGWRHSQNQNAQGGHQSPQGVHQSAQGGYQHSPQGGYQSSSQAGYQNAPQGGYQKSAQAGYQKGSPLPPDHPANPMFDHQLKNGLQLASTPSDPYATPAGAHAVGAGSWQGQQGPPQPARTPSFEALADATAPAMAAAGAVARGGHRSASSRPSRTPSHASASPEGPVPYAGSGAITAAARRTEAAVGVHTAASEGNYLAHIALPQEASTSSNSEPTNKSSAHQSLFFMTSGTTPGQAGAQAGAREGERREEAQDFLHQHAAKNVTVVPGDAAAADSCQTLLKTMSKNAREEGYIPEGPAHALVQQLDWIEANKKGLLLGKYRLQGAAQRRSGGQGMVAFASDPYTTAVYALKFYFSASSFQREKAAITHPALERAMPACVDIVDSEQERQLPPPQGTLPLMIVTEKGECLSEYMKRKHPDYVTSMQVIVQIAEKLRTMHNSGWAHRDLKPGNTIWLPSRNTWSLIDFGCAGKLGVKVPISFTLRYAAPETVAAFQRGKSTCTADTAVDVFAFGIMCYELLTRAPYYPDGVNGQEVGEMLAGNKHLPHETMSNTHAKRLGVLRGAVLKMLDRSPQTRSSISELLRFCSDVFQVNNNSTTQV